MRWILFWIELINAHRNMSTHVYTTNRKSNILIISECEPGCELTPVYYSVYQSDVNFHPKKVYFSEIFPEKNERSRGRYWAWAGGDELLCGASPKIRQ